MDDFMVCPDCREVHSEPADAMLGIEVRCLGCIDAFAFEYTVVVEAEAA